MTTYTSGLRLTNQPTGGNANTWGTIVDDNFEFIDDALTSRVSVDITGGSSHTLTTNNGSDDEARKAEIYIHGTPSSANSVIIPSSEKFYFVKAAHTSVAGGITLRTAAGTGIALSEGDKGVVYCDGVSVEFYGQPFIATSALDPSNNLSDVGEVSAARANLGLEPSSPLEVVSGSALTINTSALVSTIFDSVWPIGSLYSNRTDGTNPGTLMGFGTWVSAGVGRVLVGVGTGIDENGVSVTISAQTCGGEYEHTMTTAEMPVHSHGLDRESIAGASQGPGLNVANDAASGTDFQTNSEGGGDAFNIQQPWYSVYFWERTS